MRKSEMPSKRQLQGIFRELLPEDETVSDRLMMQTAKKHPIYLLLKAQEALSLYIEGDKSGDIDDAIRSLLYYKALK